MFKIRPRLTAACLFTASITACHATSLLPEDTKPNVLFIVADDLNTALSGYGHPQCKTPNLDKLASAGVSFTQAYCQWPICGPSRASILTGQYPLKNGVLGNGTPIKKERITLPRHFMNNGYWSVRVSKLYHMRVPGDIVAGTNGDDHAPSWLERHNITALETYTPGQVENVTAPQATEHYPEIRKRWEAEGLPREHARTLKGGHTWVIVKTEAKDSGLLPDAMAADKAIEVLRERAKKEEPFFMGFGLVRPHYPYVAPEHNFNAYPVSEIPLVKFSSEDMQNVPSQAINKDLRIDDDARKRIRQAYYATISYMDEQVGRVLAEVDQLGLRDNTIIVFLSDHGYLLGEHQSWKKNLLWEEATRVPLIIAAPGQQIKGVNCDHLVELVDLYPTLAELAGLPTDPGAQGLSLVPLLRDPERGGLLRKDTLSQAAGGYALRQGKWAYMWYPAKKKIPQASMLYDMDKDPGQLNNIAENPEFKTIREQLHKRLMERIELAKN
ncbi:MAG: sulfatase [Verrucomicrobiota bacterium]